MNWGPVPDWLTFAAAAVAALTARQALHSWREQLSGQAEHTLRLEVVTAAKALRYAFYDARNPFVSAVEFPESYHIRPIGCSPAPVEEADEWAHVYAGRFRDLWVYIRAFADLRPKAGAVLGDVCADALEQLARTARKLENLFRQRIGQISAGPALVSSWPDQAWVAYVTASVEVSPDRDDSFSEEFEAAMATVFRSVGMRYPAMPEDPWWAKSDP